MSKAIVKWNAATKVFDGVYLNFFCQHTAFGGYKWDGGVHDFVWLDQTMLNGLLQSHTCALLVLKDAHVEREGARLFLHLREYRTGCLHLELVRYRVIALIDCRSRFF